MQCTCCGERGLVCEVKLDQSMNKTLLIVMMSIILVRTLGLPHCSIKGSCHYDQSIQC